MLISRDALTPGAIDTDMGLHNRYGMGNTEKPVEFDNPERTMFGNVLHNLLPLGQTSEPGEIASAALFLASNASSHIITGHTPVVNGKWMA